MKQFFKTIILSVLFVLASTNAQAQLITAQEAQEIANTFFSQAISHTRSASSPLVKVWDSSLLNVSTRSADAPTFHVFAPQDGVGFVIVSGEQSNNPIIGYSLENGISSVDELPLGMVDYLSDIDREIRAVRARGVASVSTRAAAPETEIGTVVKYLETANWGQRHPYNQLATNKAGEVSATGCVPTAHAIVMRYHEWPASPKRKVYNMYTGEIIATTDYVYNWAGMPLNNPSDEEGLEISALMQHLGHAFMVEYSPYGTGTTEMTGKLERFWGYTETHAQRTDYTDEDWTARLKSELDANRPMVYCASNHSTGDTRHAFVLDGYTDKDYFHFNWGWYGSCNGYFLLSSMVADTGNDYTQYENTAKAHFVYFLAPSIECNVTVSAITNPATENGGTATASAETVVSGSEVVLTATPAENYNFVGWSKDGSNIIGTDNPYTVTVTENSAYFAHFEEKAKYTITVTSSDPALGSATVNGSASSVVYAGDTVTLVATANDENIFLGWYVGDEVVSTEAVYTVVVQDAAEYTAKFEAYTGIDNVQGSNGEQLLIYDLTGRRIKEISKQGVYIVNGKKVLVK